MNSRLLPLDRWLLENRRSALILAAALAAFVPICWIVIQANGSFPDDDGLVSWRRHPHPSQPFAFVAHVFALLGNPIVACLSVALVWVLVDRLLGPRYGILVFAAVGVVAFNALLKTILVAMLLLILGMGPFRVIDGAHWPRDVLAGYALGLAWTIMVLAIGLPWATGQSA